jgi:putative transport protein
MQPFLDTLVQFPILGLFLAIGVGYLFGEISFFGFRFGIAGVLFAGLAVGALDPRIALPEIVPTLGLIVFVYMVGLHSGPALVQTIRQRGYRDSVFAGAILVFGAGLAYAASWILKLTGAGAAGLFCGAFTNTPALAAARETVRELAGKSGMGADQIKALADQPVVSYSIAYPVGVVGVLLTFQLLRKLWRVKPVENVNARPIEVRDFVVRNPEVAGETVAAVCQSTAFAVSRVHRAGRTDVATPATRLELGTVVAVVGDSDAHAEAEDLFGEPSAMRIEGDNSRIVYRRMIVSSEHVVGRTIAELRLERFPATVSRVRRGDSETVATPETRLEYGDMLRVLTHRNKTKDVRKLFGDSVRGAAEAHFGAVALGIVMGVLLGMVPVPLPHGGTLKLGYAGGPLIVALILGKLGRTGRINWVVPAGANLSLRQIGLLLFLAGVGTRAGWEFLRTLQHNGLPTLLGGAAITLTVTAATLFFGHKVLRMPFDFVTGVMSGIQTQPACLAFAAAQAKNDQPNVGYASVYPAATIAKIILAQLLVTLLPAARAAEAPDGIAPAAPRTQSATLPKRPPMAKLPRPGVSGIAGVPPVGGCLIVEGFSREPNAAGVQTAGLTGFYECSVSKRIALWAQPTHWLRKSGVSGIGYIAFGPKVLLNHETRTVPLFALGYSFKQPTATYRLGSGLNDHKVTLYADKNFGPTRVTGNFAAKWEGHQDKHVRQCLESIAVATPVRGKLGAAFQTFYSTSPLARYGGAVAAGVYSFRPNLAVQFGLEHGFGPKSPGTGVILGVNYLYRGPTRHPSRATAEPQSPAPRP